MVAINSQVQSLNLKGNDISSILISKPSPYSIHFVSTINPSEPLFEKTIDYAEQPLHVIGTGNAIIYAGFLDSDFPEEYHRERAKEFTRQFTDKKTTTSINPWPNKKKLPQSLALLGTPFQKQVWQALLGIPAGKLTTYKTLGQWLTPVSKGYQAIGNAVGANPISGLIPCHRVIPNPTSATTVAVGGFYWGSSVKIKLLENELAL